MIGFRPEERQVGGMIIKRYRSPRSAFDDTAAAGVGTRRQIGDAPVRSLEAGPAQLPRDIQNWKVRCWPITSILGLLGAAAIEG
jgi:hypothetical protein